MKIAQISDIHIPPTDQKAYGANIRENFLITMEYILDKGFDHLMITGDLAFENGEVDAYLWLKHELEQFPIPYTLLSGNHDSVANMTKVFGLEDKLKQRNLYFKTNLGTLPCYCLDTTNDRLSKDQMKWMINESVQSTTPSALFIHHPITLSGCRFMDKKHPLRNVDAAMEMLAKCAHIKWVFCGHYHTDKHIRLENADLYITPSTWYQIDTQSEAFSISKSRPGLREIHWDEDKATLQTNVVYL